jgi:hypothetical protein
MDQENVLRGTNELCCYHDKYGSVRPVLPGLHLCSTISCGLGAHCMKGRNRIVQVAILVPASERGYFVASWWRTPLRHPPKVTRFYFQQTLIFMRQWEKKRLFFIDRSPVPIADSFHVATMARRNSALNLREINRNNTHTALATVLSYYGRVYLIF